MSIVVAQRWICDKNKLKKKLLNEHLVDIFVAKSLEMNIVSGSIAENTIVDRDMHG